jgi:hypothetical protein
MAYLIDKSFFVGELNIVNPEDAKVTERINWFIAKYEPECLRKLLGYELAKLLKSETSTRMTNLKDGTEYTDTYGRLKEWTGLVNGKTSLIANYVYYKFERDKSTVSTAKNTQVSKGENAIIVSSGEKQLKAWNDLCQKAYELTEFLYYSNLYPEFTYIDFIDVRRYFQRQNLFGI